MLGILGKSNMTRSGDVMHVWNSMIENDTRGIFVYYFPTYYIRLVLIALNVTAQKPVQKAD